GLWRASGWSSGAQVRRTAVRRFSRGTIVLHALAMIAVLVGLITGAWQYLKGLLDVASPVPMPLVYRIHYLAATLLLFVMAAALTDWLVRGADALKVPKGQWIRHLRGLSHELPGPLGATLAYVLGLDRKRAPPPTDEFTP